MPLRRLTARALAIIGLLGGCSSGTGVGAAAPAAAAPAQAQAVAQPPAAPAGATRGAPVPCPLAGEKVREPYPWYPALDLARVPFHAGDGPWGKRARVTAPQAPITRQVVTVNSAEELTKAALTPGSEITVGRSIDQTVVLMGDVIDVDIIVPPGVTLQNVLFGSFNPPSVTRRVRVRGPRPMTHSGGLLGALEFYSQQTSDVIIDGVDLNGADGKAGTGLYTFRTGERIAIVNVRGRSVGWGSADGGTTDLVVAGCNIMTGARPREANGYPEGWGSRGGNRIVFFRNYLEGTRYHRVRIHPAAGTTQYAWLAENVFIDPYEARIAAAFDIGGTVPGARVSGFWAQCNLIHAHSSCLPPSFEAPSASYAQLTHNVFHGSFTRELQAGLQRQHGAQHDYLTGNDFHPWSAPPPYPPPGDPRQVPLPADNPSDDNPALKGAPCPGP